MEVFHIRGLQEAYQNVYYTEETFFSDLADVCTEYFFDSFEDSNYFVNELIEQDLLDEFLSDFSEELGIDISYYLEENKGKLASAALRGIINAFSSTNRSKAGLTAATALGKRGQPIGGSAASTAIRAARRAASSSTPVTPQPGRYLQALQSKRAARGLPPAGGTTAGTPRAIAQRETTAGWQRDRAARETAQTAINNAATVARAFMKSLKQSAAKSRLNTAASGTRGTGINIGQPGASRLQLPAAGETSRLSPDGQEIQRLNKMIGGGLMGTTKPTNLGPRAPKPAWGTGNPPEVKPPNIKQKNQVPVTSRRSQTTTSMPFRATGPGGSARTQRLASQAAPPSNLRTSTSGLTSSDASNDKALKNLVIASTGTMAFNATQGALKDAQNKKDAETRQNIKTGVFNTMDPNGTIRNRKKVGSAKIGDTFQDAFKFYRKRGDKKFKYAGKEYTTDLASESYEGLELFANILVNEGYVKDYNGAVSMINSLDKNGLNTLTERIIMND